MEKSLKNEWDRLKEQENRYLWKNEQKETSKLNQMLEEKVPEKLQGTLDTAFAKAFQLVFERGTVVIEKMYNKGRIERDYKINSFLAGNEKDVKSLRRFSESSSTSASLNMMISGLEGVGLGVLGIGLPDIPLFTAMLLKGVYETALHYGYSYESAGEKYFILRLIQGALSYGDDLRRCNAQVNKYIITGSLPDGYEQKEQIKETSETLSRELLYMKFLQGVFILGAVGGAYDAIYMQKVLEYADLKYHKRFLYDALKKSKSSADKAE